jgi:D-threonine aldolase
MNTETLTRSSWYEIENIELIDSPAIVIYPKLVEQNIRHAIEMVGNASRLRPHAKTNKSKEATLMMIGEGITKFKCATIAEAEMLALSRADDVLLAYQPLGPKLKRLVTLIRKYPGVKFSCLVDNADAANEIALAAESNDLIITVYLDINVGMNRTGISTEKAVALYVHCLSLQALKVAGLHVYDGHIHDGDLQTRRKRSNKAFASVEQLKAGLKNHGLTNPVVIAGGSPTFPVHAERKDVECSPGTFVYWDRNYQVSCAEQPFVPAALVISRVISIPTETTICLDLGHKSVASENDIERRVYFLNAPELKCISHSEEHLVVQAPASHNYKVGDVFYGLPYHICPTAALYERAITVEGNKVTGEWRMIARDRQISV